MRAVIAEDNALLRDGLTLLLTDNDINVIGSVDNATELLDIVAARQPDLVIADVRMPPTHTNEGILAAIAIRRDQPEVAVLVLSQWVELTYARQLLAANPAKIGYLLKDRVMRSRDFVEAARRVASGGTALDPDVVRALHGVRKRRETIGTNRIAAAIGNAPLARWTACGQPLWS